MFIYAFLIVLPALALAQDNNGELEDKLFGVLDGNGDNQITVSETETYFLTFDTDKDGDITEAEFKAALNNLDPAFNAHEDALYQLFDRDANGEVNKADIDIVFGVADMDGDGSVGKIEFHIIFSLVISQVGG